MIDRWLFHRLQQEISRFPAVGIVGSRQVGKTTLARQIAKNLNRELSLENLMTIDELKINELYN